MKRHVVLTGNGKGKTSSAMGMALRALGHGQKVAIGQFVKSRADVGEYKFLSPLENMEFQIFGKGFLPKIRDSRWDKHADHARAGWEWAKIALTQSDAQMVILDEFHHVLHFELIPVDEVKAFWASIAPDKILITTGRNAPDWLCDMADTVSVVECPKHGWEMGIKAQEGVEF